MADQISDEDYLAANPQYASLDPAIRNQLKEKDGLKAELDAERATRTSLEKRAAFAEANLTDLPHRELFEKTYEGEMTAEAIRTEAEKYGLVGTAATPPAPENRADLDALRRVQAASAGAPPNAPMDFGEALDRATNIQEWEAVMAQAPPEAGVRLRGTYQGSRLI
jgi:hypothetical protein